MIEKMKKLTFLVTSKEYESFLADIRQLGVVHIAEQQKGATSSELQHYLDKANRYKEVLKSMDYAVGAYANESTPAPQPLKADAKKADEVMRQLDELLAEENSLRHQLDDVQKCKEQLYPWGNFDWSTLRELEEYGFNTYFYACSPKLFKEEWQKEYFATEILDYNKKTYFVAFAKQTPDINAELLQLPEKNLDYYKEEEIKLKDQLANVRQRLYTLSCQEKPSILAAQTENENGIDLSKVHLNTESIAADAVKLMEGWVMEAHEQKVVDYLEKERIFYELSNPSLEDDVPVKITNGWYSRLFEPILKMYSLPNYHDLDITPYLAPFFMLFFGLCMGDAGYGLLIFGVSFYLSKKLDKDKKPFATLGMFLGGMTVVVGLLTGSFFGIDLSQQEWAFLAPVKKYFINENNYQIAGYSPMMVISVIIGLIQVLFGMVLSAVKSARLYGWKHGIGRMSWVVGILTALATFGLPACGVALPQWLTYLFYGVLAICVFGIFFMNSPGKNVLLNFGTGVWDTYGMTTGLLGDLLSYIRLFALGLTGGVLGGVFNTLAIDLTSGMSWGVRWLPMLIILLLGHGINFALCMISSFVHPMRLTFVEFFKNANFEGGGKAYDPFRVKTYEGKE